MSVSDTDVDFRDPMQPIPLSVNPFTLSDDVVRERIANLIDAIDTATEHSSNEPRHLLPVVEELCSDFGFKCRHIPTAEHMIGDLERILAELSDESDW